MVTPDRKPYARKRRIGYGSFDFASVGLAAASGRLSMDAFAAYLGAMRPRRKKARRG